MKLYQLEGCPYCAKVSSVLDEKGIGYETINVPGSKDLRTELIEVSGQDSVPVIVDNGEVVSDSERIIAFLNEKY